MKRSLGAKTVLTPAPVWIIGSYDKEGKPNIMAASWACVCSSKPPCVTVSLRESRHTYKNILERRSFTVSVPGEKHLKEADYVGIVSGANGDKFKTTGLTPVKSDLVDAPYIKEFSLVAECALLKHIKLGTHTMFVGEIKDIKCDQEILGDMEMPDMSKLETFIFDPGTHKYYKVGRFLAKGFQVGNDLRK
ncbi:MAG: flavin reductase family protein [Candidatus Omnitrophota bacterium]